MVSSWALCLCLSVCLATLPQTTGVPATKHIHIILVGANGNLAKKYLWQSWFDLTHSQSDTTAFQVWAGTRLSNDDAYTQLPNLIRSSIQTCPPEFDSSKCEAAINAFVEACAFVRLKTEHDYEELSSAIEHTSHREDGRLFYLSVPPSAYPFLAKTISTVARPSPSAWLRVVFEKPFGSDLSSAKELSEQLSTYLQEHEIYRIDHYLGKPGVQQIMQFKTENRQLFNKLFHSNRVQRVEIVSTEKEDCAGRTRFYNEYGVIRDIFQNHLTEILALVAMEIPDDTVSATHAQLKTRVLQSVRTDVKTKWCKGMMKSTHSFYFLRKDCIFVECEKLCSGLAQCFTTKQLHVCVRNLIFYIPLDQCHFPTACAGWPIPRLPVTCHGRSPTTSRIAPYTNICSCNRRSIIEPMEGSSLCLGLWKAVGST
eukprot:m.25922 g.25922  ORF g.25922 m.25922 type:complete len:426 (-) comp8777_c0_seq4:699-1976(-)